MSENVLIVAHIGQTLGHLARGISLGESLRDKGVSVSFAGHDWGRTIVPDRFEYHSISWDWSHNSLSPYPLSGNKVEAVIASGRALVTLLETEQPDLVIGFPGVFTAPVARMLGIDHISVLHATYLCPWVVPGELTHSEQKVFDFLRTITVDGVFDALLQALADTLGTGCMSYLEFLETERLFVPQPGLPIADKGMNALQFGFIRASLGNPNGGSAKLAGLRPSDSACYVTFGTGNPCEITSIARAALNVFDEVIVTSPPGTVDETIDRVTYLPLVPSELIGDRVSLVVSHGGIGTVGTFAAFETPQVIVPTEIDQAVMAAWAPRIEVAVSYGLESWARNPQLGRRLPEVREREFAKVLEDARTRPVPKVDTDGATVIAALVASELTGQAS